MSVRLNTWVWDIPALPHRRVNRQVLPEADIQILFNRHRIAEESGLEVDRQPLTWNVIKRTLAFQDTVEPSALLLRQ